MEYFPLSPQQTVLERYIVEKEIGYGGLGAVYQAYDKKRNENVALKLSKFVANEEQGIFLEREYEVLKALSHPNIPKGLEIHHLDTGEKLMSMELIEGAPLSHKIEESHFEFDEAIGVIYQIALTLKHVHEKGIVHRDLKPDNIMVLEDGEIKIIDFGSTNKKVEKEREGTYYYMAPEHLKGQSVTGTADIYALGIISFELLTGQRPYEDEKVFSTRSERLSQLESIATLRPDLPKWIQTFILTAASRFSRLRYSADNVVELIEDRCPNIIR